MLIRSYKNVRAVLIDKGQEPALIHALERALSRVSSELDEATTHRLVGQVSQLTGEKDAISSLLLAIGS